MKDVAPLARGRHRRQPIARPRQTKRPIDVVHGRRLVDRDRASRRRPGSASATDRSPRRRAPRAARRGQWDRKARRPDRPRAPGAPRSAPCSRACVPRGALVPPDGHRLGVVRAGRSDRTRRIVGRVLERMPCGVPGALPSCDTKAGTPVRASDARTKSGTVPRSSAMISAPGSRRIVEHPFAERGLRRLVGRDEKRLAAVPRPAVGAIEADQVIDAIAVVTDARCGARDRGSS